MSTENKTIKCRILALLVSGLVFVCAIYVLNNTLEQSPLAQKENKQASFSDRYSGFEINTQISKIIISKEYESTNNFKVENDEAVSFNNVENNNKLDAYNLEYQIITPNEKYMDIALFINDKKITAKLSGLSYKNKISFKMNDDSILNEVPVDWAGRISFQTPVLSNTDDQLLCFDVLDSDTKVKSICHKIIQTGEAA